MLDRMGLLTTKASELLSRCPFCGNDEKKIWFWLGSTYTIRCQECGAAVGADTFEEAKKKWNRREGAKT